MYILVDLHASLASAIYLNALKMLKTLLGRREETELAHCKKNDTVWEQCRTRQNFNRTLTVSVHGYELVLARLQTHD